MRFIVLTALTALLSLGLAAPVMAAPKVGDALPRLVLSGEDEGLMRRSGDDDVRYSRFDTQRQLKAGKVYLITYMAGRKSAKAMGKSLQGEMLKRPPSKAYQPVNVMNLDDCIFGTCGFARGKFEDHLHEKPTVMHVIDEEGRGFKLWGAMEEGMAIYVVGHDGIITHMARGPFTAASAKAVGKAVDAAVAAIP